MRRLRYTAEPPMSLRDLADAAGLSVRTVWGIENSRHTSPQSMDAVAKVLGVTRGELL
jgi:transcriptional regulator with XRE-family HTH domain